MKRGVLLIIGVVLILVIILIFVFARGGGNNTTSTASSVLKIWLPYDEVRTYREISQSFMEAHPELGLEVKYIEAKDARDYEAKVVNELADGSGPDIWVVRNDWIPKHALKSEPMITADPKVDAITLTKTTLESAVVDANTYQGKLYGLPLAGDTLAVIYNSNFYSEGLESKSAEDQAVLTRQALTWDDLKNQVKAVSSSSGDTVQRSGIALGTVENTFAPADVLTAFLLQKSASILTADGKDVGFNLAAYKGDTATFPATEALDYFAGFAKPGNPQYAWNSAQGDPIEAFINGKTGALIGYYSTLKIILERNPSFKIVIGRLPQPVVDETTPRVDYGITWSHIVNKDSTLKGLAWDYLYSLTAEYPIESYASKTGKLSTSADRTGSSLPSGVVTTDSAELIFSGQLANIKLFVKPEWQRTDEILQDAVKQVVSLGKSAQNSADSAAERFKAEFVSP